MQSSVSSDTTREILSSDLIFKPTNVTPSQDAVANTEPSLVAATPAVPAKQ